jgi:hypothetical protein
MDMGDMSLDNVVRGLPMGEARHTSTAKALPKLPKCAKGLCGADGATDPVLTSMSLACERKLDGQSTTRSS